MNYTLWLQQNTAPLAGKRIAVTGSTGGLGTALCHHLAALGASLVLLDRNPQKAATLHTALMAAHPALELTHITVDLSAMNTVRAACDKLEALGVDVLVHNAGAYAIPRHRCDTGYDNVFQIDFVSPYYMTRRLLPMLRQRQGRVVVVGSIAHNYSKTDPTDVDFSTRKASSKVYGNAKRHLMFAMYELFREEREVTLSVVHPGITFTGITAHYPPLLFTVIKHPMKWIFMPVKKASLCLLRGVFEGCGYHEWIGPRLFDVWGLPKKRRLRTCTVEESRRIGDAAQAVWEHITQEATV